MRSRILRSTNPMLRSINNSVLTSDYPATYTGIATKTMFLFLVLVTSVGTVWAYMDFFIANTWTFFAAMIGGFISVMIASFAPKTAKIFAPVYAILEGIVLGALTYFVGTFVAQGLVETAILITLSIFGVMLILYMTGAVRVGPFLRRLTISMLFGLVAFSGVMLLLSLFGSNIASIFFGNMQFMLIFSLISAAIASLMILLDLDNCSMIVKSGAPKEYEWSAGLGLLVTIIWLFIEILRILIIFASRRD